MYHQACCTGVQGFWGVGVQGLGCRGFRVEVQFFFAFWVCGSG